VSSRPQQLAGENAAAGADLDHPASRGLQELDQRGARASVDQVVLAQGAA
jgi:hypothetical protein